MANRHKDFNELVALEFQDPAFAKAYITNLINEEGLSLEAALKESIKSMGLQNFAEKANVSISYISDFIHDRKSWSTDKMIELTEEIFKLKLQIIVNQDTGKIA
jgi:hypothetical protein